MDSGIPASIQQMMNPHLPPHSITSEEHKSMTQPTIQPAIQPAGQEQITPYLTIEEQLRRTMSRCDVVWQG